MFYLVDKTEDLSPGHSISALRDCTEEVREDHNIKDFLPHERLTDLAVVPREKPHTGAAAREQPRDSPVIER